MAYDIKTRYEVQSHMAPIVNSYEHTKVLDDLIIHVEFIPRQDMTLIRDTESVVTIPVDYKPAYKFTYTYPNTLYHMNATFKDLRDHILNGKKDKDGKFIEVEVPIELETNDELVPSQEITLYEVTTIHLNGNSLQFIHRTVVINEGGSDDEDDNEVYRSSKTAFELEVYPNKDRLLVMIDTIIEQVELYNKAYPLTMVLNVHDKDNLMLDFYRNKKLVIPSMIIDKGWYGIINLLSTGMIGYISDAVSDTTSIEWDEKDYMIFSHPCRSFFKYGYCMTYKLPVTQFIEFINARFIRQITLDENDRIIVDGILVTEYDGLPDH